MVLIVGLILLVLLTLLAVSAMHGTILQERMAGNSRDRMLAFQAAEAALRQAETLLGNAGLPSGTGIYMTLNTSPAAAYTSAQQWDTAYPWSTSSAALGTGTLPLAEIVAQPLYVIERLTTTPPPNAPNVDDNEFGPSAGHGYFRITSRGVGATTNATVILQEYYVR